ncbi:DNA replication licensing factor MCM2 [Spraguea lophii 42_110]|uniref:DNA replication licensing factor MCM2 n=1 Tax=Spraguea lophii (strain 42_110) TaxID=1358809 RepID=S7XL75_SPRLO|nr:DNA replication licensing factor MCM2 [Spraguea lophii 42_110]
MDNPNYSSSDIDNMENDFESQLFSQFVSEDDINMQPSSDIEPVDITDEVQLFKSQLLNSFVDFLNNFENKKYIKKIREMCSYNKESLYVSYMDIEKYSGNIIVGLIKKTEEVMEVLDQGLDRVVQTLFPNYKMIKNKVHVRITDVPLLENIRNLRNEHLNSLVRVNGVVTRRSGVFPLLSVVKYTCLKCKCVFGPFIVDKDEFKPTNCLECQSKGPFTVKSQETIYKDFQKITIQEIPGTVPPGALPRSKEVMLFYDLIDVAKPGEEIEVIGVYKNSFSLSLNIKSGFPVFFTTINAITINKKENEFENSKLVSEDIKEIIKMSRHPNIVNIITNSIAPSIHGHKNVKRSIALALFGGQQKIVENHKIRGDINVLLLGDPGTAKSQFLRYVEGVAHRAVLSTGQGASSVGLTATVRKDTVTKEWTLEGGALVLADKGICLIDEFDKMNDKDRTSIHEAMEQQSISISKAGIVASLHARCGVIAAANPVRGFYNSSLTFSQNVNLSDPIISRFDILCVIKDQIEQGSDENMARFILNTHSSIEEEKTNFMPSQMRLSQNFLKKYIIYARQNVFPTIPPMNLDKISKLYVELRKESMGIGTLPITVRHIEGIVRMSESFARMRLSPTVSSEDIDLAINLSLDSFLRAQKYSVTKNLKQKFAKYLGENNNQELSIFILNEMFKDKIKSFRTLPSNVIIGIKDFEKRIKNYNIKLDDDILRNIEASGYLVNKESKKIIKILD